MKILYVTRDLRDGDLVEHELARLMPQVQISVSPSADDALARLEALTSKDAVLLDQPSLGPDAVELIRKVRASGPSLFIVALCGTAEAGNADQFVQAGADESLVKSGGYLERLTRTLQRLNGVQDKAPGQRGEDRLRLILEQMPACVVMIAPDGSIMALNWAGLPVVGAQRLDQVVGKKFVSFLPPEAQEPFGSFLSAVCAG